MVIFLLKLILGSVGQWSRSRPSVKMDQLVCQAFFVAVVVFFFRFFFHLGLFRFILTADSLQLREVFTINVSLVILI